MFVRTGVWFHSTWWRRFRGDLLSGIWSLRLQSLVIQSPGQHHCLCCQSSDSAAGQEESLHVQTFHLINVVWVKSTQGELSVAFNVPLCVDSRCLHHKLEANDWVDWEVIVRRSGAAHSGESLWLWHLWGLSAPDQLTSCLREEKN